MGEKAKMKLSKTNLSGKHADDGLNKGNNGNLPNKLKMDDLDASFSSSFGVRQGSGRSNRNRDPGVESDEEEDDMFKVSVTGIKRPLKDLCFCPEEELVASLCSWLSLDKVWERVLVAS